MNCPCTRLQQRKRNGFDWSANDVLSSILPINLEDVRVCFASCCILLFSNTLLTTFRHQDSPSTRRSGEVSVTTLTFGLYYGAQIDNQINMCMYCFQLIYNIGYTKLIGGQHYRFFKTCWWCALFLSVCSNTEWLKKNRSS